MLSSIKLVQWYSNPFLMNSFTFLMPGPITWFCLFKILLLSLPATPKMPKFIIDLLSRVLTLLFRLSHKGKPDKISSNIDPRLHMSNTYDIFVKSKILKLSC